MIASPRLTGTVKSNRTADTSASGTLDVACGTDAPNVPKRVTAPYLMLFTLHLRPVPKDAGQATTTRTGTRAKYIKPYKYYITCVENRNITKYTENWVKFASGLHALTRL